jgi:hypothetical protein
MVLRLLSILTLSLGVASVTGWGTEGHEMVANVAYERLTPQTREAVLSILGPTNGTEDAGSPLAAVADWADRVRYHYHWSAPLHYIDVRDDTIKGGCPAMSSNSSSTITKSATECQFLYVRDCPNDICVAGAIRNYTSQLSHGWTEKHPVTAKLPVLRSTSNNEKENQVREALMFLTQ